MVNPARLSHNSVCYHGREHAPAFALFASTLRANARLQQGKIDELRSRSIRIKADDVYLNNDRALKSSRLEKCLEFLNS